jgi:hypothetical protein
MGLVQTSSPVDAETVRGVQRKLIKEVESRKDPDRSGNNVKPSMFPRSQRSA